MTKTFNLMLDAFSVDDLHEKLTAADTLGLPFEVKSDGSHFNIVLKIEAWEAE